MHNFEETYKSLNDEQKLAVNTIDGPLLVLAGPGTGKTQLLSARVANILLKTDTDPANIVCLTFTVNAANNMRDRLRKMIGPAANQVVIKTFHSLAADIISSHPEYFYAGAVLNPVSDLAAQQIMQPILDTLPHDSPLAARYDDKYTHLGNALGAIGKAKDAGLTPKKLRNIIKNHLKEIEAIESDVVALLSQTLSHKNLENLAHEFDQLALQYKSDLAVGVTRLINEAIIEDLPTGKTTQTGKLKAKLLGTQDGRKVMARERKANAWWSCLADVYEAYQAKLYKRGYLDYSDMLISVIEALETNEDLRLDLQETVHYLLVDEFQDSNEAQIKLLHLLVDNPNIEKPNVMVVGDPNQTIYGFNGAMLDNTTDFQQFYNHNLTSVELTKNYRSSQSILDNSRTVITPYSTFHPNLVAMQEPENTQVAYTAYATEPDQAVWISKNIADKLHHDSKSTVAVLARDHRSLTYLSRYLTHTGLTVNYEQSIDIRNTSCNTLIITTLALIQAVTQGNRQESNYRFSELLRHPALKLEPETVWKLAIQAKRSSSWLDLASELSDTKPLVSWINHLVSIAASQPLHVLIEQLLSTEFTPGQTLYIRFYEGVTAESAVLEAQATRQLLEIAKQYAETDRFNLASFVHLLQETSDKLFMFSPSTGHYENAVTLMTVHGAKGLEFDHVYVINGDEANWKAKAARYPTPLSLPIHVNIETPADYARLMYVAMTRAKQTLHVSYVTRIDSKTIALPAEQLAEFTFNQAEQAANDDIALSEIAQLIPQQSRPKTMHELLGQRLEAYSLNATHLINFLDLTKQGMNTFIEENLIHFPSPASEVLAHGNAMHACMELAQIQTTNGKVDLDAIKRLYSHKISEENLTTAVIDRLTSRAHAQLDVLFSKLGLAFDATSRPEQSYSAITKDGLNLYGKIDRIDIHDDNTVELADYKTGKPITNPASKAQDVLLKQWRHRLQLGFYILLLKQQKQFASKHIKAQIIQLDAAAPEQLRLTYDLDTAELERIEKLALAVFRRIKALDIPDVSQFEPSLNGIKQFEEWLLAN